MTMRAVVAIDLQNDYLPTGKLPLKDVDAAVIKAARVIAAARALAIPVIHVRHVQPAGSPFFALGEAGADIIAEVAPLGNEPVVIKQFANSFRDTRLKEILDELSIDTLVVVGAMSHMCVEATTRAAADMGSFAITVVHDACATRDLEFEEIVVPSAYVHAASMAALAFGYASVTSTAEWLSEVAAE